MAIAQGEYVTFPDADDWLDPQLHQILMSMVQADDLDAAQCNAVRVARQGENGEALIPLERLRSTDVLTGPDWLDLALSTRRYLHVVWLGVYRSALIQRYNLNFCPGLHHQEIPWTTEFMLNAQRVRYCEQPLYRYTQHDASISNRICTGRSGMRYQRHYLKICRMLEKINQRYQQQVRIYSAVRAQVTREALGVCHAMRREADAGARRTMLNDIWRTGTHLRMLRNARGICRWYQLLLWLGGMLRWDWFSRQKSPARK